MAVVAMLVVLYLAVNVTRITETSISETIVSSQGGVYVSHDLAVDRISIDWGLLYVGDNTTEVVQITNTGNAPQTLGLTTRNWSSVEAQTFLTLTWNYSGIELQPSGMLSVALTLSVSPSIENVTDFAFDIVVSGS